MDPWIVIGVWQGMWDMINWQEFHIPNIVKKLTHVPVLELHGSLDGIWPNPLGVVITSELENGGRSSEFDRVLHDLKLKLLPSH